MFALFAPFGLDAAAATLPVDRQSPIEELRAAATAAEQAFEGVFAALLANVPTSAGVESTVETITGVDGNEITPRGQADRCLGAAARPAAPARRRDGDPAGRLDRIDGVYAQVPFIYGGYDPPDPALPSLVENDGYFLGSSVMTLMAAVYDRQMSTPATRWRGPTTHHGRPAGPAATRHHHRRTGSAA